MFEYLREELESELRSGRVSVAGDPDQFFALLGKRFPVGLNRIAWEKVSNRRSVEVLPEPRAISSDELRTLLVPCRDDVQSWLDDVELEETGDQVVWIGDSTDAALAMSKSALLEFFPILFSFPQHSYALPRDASWCLNYVMEGELFFGRAAPNR